MRIDKNTMRLAVETIGLEFASHFGTYTIDDKVSIKEIFEILYKIKDRIEDSPND